MRNLIRGAILLAAAATSVIATPALAQDRLPTGAFPYEDHGAEDPSFAAFRAQLLRAAHRRDVEALLALSRPDIFLGFGGDAGRADFRRMLGDTPELWGALIYALENGTWRTDDGYTAPYWFSMPFDGGGDPYTTAFVPARDVVVRARPSREAQAIAAVSYGFVSVREPFSPTGDYLPIRTASGVDGFLHVEFARSLIGYRAGFSKNDAGAWEMRFFLAGD